jgi:hypothetical protein
VARDADEQVRLGGPREVRAPGLPVGLEGLEELGLVLGEPCVEALREPPQAPGTVEILEGEPGQAQGQRGAGIGRVGRQRAHITEGVRANLGKRPMKNAYFTGVCLESK